jgi:Cd2+-exporting ATPase
MHAERERCSGRCCTSTNTARRSFWGLRCSNTSHGNVEDPRVSHDHEMCRRILSKSSYRSMAATISDCSGKSCCHRSGSHSSHTNEAEMSDCSGKNCSRGRTSCQSDRFDLAPASPNSNKLQNQFTNTASITEVDLDGFVSNVKHVILSVQGMDCTSCEEKLRRAIISISDISNIKVSLLLSRAEFHLVESIAYNGGNIARIIRSRTGFKCTRVLPAGAELNLTVAGDAQRFLHGYPHGVTNVSIVKGNIIQVCYQPRIVGPR